MVEVADPPGFTALGFSAASVTAYDGVTGGGGVVLLPPPPPQADSIAASTNAHEARRIVGTGEDAILRKLLIFCGGDTAEEPLSH